MPSKTTRRAAPAPKSPPRRGGVVRVLRRWFWRGLLSVVTVVLLVISAHAVLDPARTIYMTQERARLGGIEHNWVDLERVAPVMLRSVVAAEDANFCQHWGFDMAAIRAALDEGGTRGASTISQQAVKNMYLWQGRTWTRKAMEATLTPVVETLWTKRRILEIYLNMIEFGEGIFGIEAASRHYFDVTPAKLTPQQAARLAAVLPDPKDRSASNPSAFLRKRAAQIVDGAATIRADGRAACFED